MNKSKHTPGPWEHIIREDRIYIGPVSDRSPDADICTVNNNPINVSNARLIATAPELAESLLELILTLRMGDTDPDVRRTRLETACAVYAKATGGMVK